MRNFDAGVACGGALENLRDDWRGFLVRDQPISVAGVFLVAKGWAGTVFAFASFHPQNILNLSGTVTQVYLIHCELKRSHNILQFRVEIVSDGYIMDLVFREELLGIVAGLPHITPQTGKVFGYDHVCFPGL